jgi:iron(III) transport system substrate-binding protein
MRITQFFLSMTALLGVFFLEGCKSEDSSGKETAESKTIVVYCSADQEFAQKIIERFTQKTGIKVLCRYDVEATKTLGLVQRLRSEASNPQADVFWSSEIFETIGLANDKILGEYSSPVTQAWPANYRDPQGRWFGFAPRARVIAYNTNLVKKADAPASIEDLLKPNWKKKLVIARPQFGTTRGHVAALWVHYGPEKAKEILSGFAANEVNVVNGNSTAVRTVAEGRAAVCLTDTDDVWVAQRNGWPVELVYPKHGSAGTLMIPNTVAMVHGTKTPHDAGVFIDFMLSEEVEQMLAESDSHNVPVRPELAKKYSKYAVPSPMEIDYVEVSKAIVPAMQAVGQVLK